MKKILMFSAVLILFCFAALLPANANAGSLSFDKIRFYESGYQLADISQRAYANAFPKSKTRYINDEVNFINYSNIDESHKLLLKYYKPDGNYVAQDYFEIYDDANNTQSSVGWIKDWDYGSIDEKKTFDLYYYRNSYTITTPQGTILLGIILKYTDFGIQNKPELPLNTTIAGYVLEIDVALNRYRILEIIYFDSKGNIIAKINHNNPKWYTPVKETMAERWVEIARELSGGK